MHGAKAKVVETVGCSLAVGIFVALAIAQPDPRLALLCAVGFLVFVFAIARRSTGREHHDLGVGAARLGLSKVAHDRWHEVARFEGERDGRRTRVAFVRPATVPVAHEVWVSVAAKEVPRIAIQRHRLETSLRDWLTGQGAVAGDAAVDGAFHVVGSGAERLRGKATGLRRVFDLGIEELVLGDGEVRARVAIHEFRLERCGPLLEALCSVAADTERVPVHVAALGASRQALHLSGSPRCAYCHAGISGDEPDLVACESCGTVLHEGCWAELGRCPVLGCTGQRPERARTT